MENILKEIKAECDNQIEKWGEQNHPILDPQLVHRSPKRMCEEYEIPSEERAKQKLDINFERGTGTYMHILLEEVSEAASCGTDTIELRKELIQVAAVTANMIKTLDRNKR